MRIARTYIDDDDDERVIKNIKNYVEEEKIWARLRFSCCTLQKKKRK